MSKLLSFKKFKVLFFPCMKSFFMDKEKKKNIKIWRFLLAKEEEKNVENQQKLIPRRLILLSRSVSWGTFFYLED